MADEGVSLGEVVRRLDRMEARLEALVRELGQRSVSGEVYLRDQREIERRFTEFERDLIAEAEARKAAIEAEAQARSQEDGELAKRMDTSGTSVRQIVYSGVLPSAFVIITAAIAIWAALRGGH